jgi:mycothiol synthase
MIDNTVTSEPAIPGLRFRPFDPDRDYPALSDLARIAALFDGTDFVLTAEELRAEHDHVAGFEARLDVLVAEIDGAMSGFSQTVPRTHAGQPAHHVAGVVAPAWRRRGLGRALLRWAQARSVEVASADPSGRSHELQSWVHGDQPGIQALLESEGYQVIRYGHRMTRDLSEPIEARELPEGLELRTVTPADHRRIWDADVEAFRDHWNATDRTEQDYLGWFAMPGLDTNLWRVAWDGEEVAGSVMNMIFPEENAVIGVDRGWLEHVSVRRPWRRRGLASALITESLLALRSAGMAEADLGVDSENPNGAVHVYEQLGFRVTRIGRLYTRPL